MKEMKYSLGLDIGVTSVGWAVIDEDSKKIVRTGVRIFEAAENPQDGSPLAEPRRMSRSTRRRLDRRSFRKNYLKNLFVEKNLLTREQIHKTLSEPHNPYEIRANALDQQITHQELFIALYHIFKRRGYKSARKKVEETDKDTGPVLGKIRENTELLKKYRTVGEMLLKDQKFADSKRNKGGSYIHTVLRSELDDEIQKILDVQKKFWLKGVDQSFKENLLNKEKRGSFNWQLNFASGDDILKKVGKCTFEKEEYRAAKRTHSFELFTILQRLNQLKIVHKELGERPLTADQKKIIVDNLFQLKDLKYKQIRSKLSLSDQETFNLARYGIKGDKAEDAVFGKLETLHEVKKEISKETWNKYFENNYGNLDTLATISTLYKTDEDVARELKKVFPKISENEILELNKFDFQKFGHLSLKAIEKINEQLLKGSVYSDACREAGYDFKGHTGNKEKKLKPLDVSERSITNPAVRRAVSQTIKVVNAIIDKYGSPYFVKVECAREMSKDFEERRKIKTDTDDNFNRNEAIKTKIREMGIMNPAPFDIVRFKLYENQQGKCAYSLKTIDENRIFEAGYTEVDHIIPFSRSGDDGNNNKVLVLKFQNQDKLNRTPYEWFGAGTERWVQFEAYVNSLQVPLKKKQNLLTQKYKNNDWNIRALNDTRSITKFLKNYIEDKLLFSEEGKDKRRVIVVNGMTTAYLRKRWGLSKIRKENLLHHATDAAVVAVMDSKLINSVSSFAKSGEIMRYLMAHKDLESMLDPETGKEYSDEDIKRARYLIENIEARRHKYFTRPWENFEHDVEKSVSEIFVSRMPKRKVTGQAHKETLRSPKLFDRNKSFLKTPLINITLEKLEDMYGKEQDKQVYEILKKRLERFNNDPKEAFKEKSYKQDKEGNNVAEIKSIKVINHAQNSGYMINDGKAVVDNGGMIRVDVFSKEIKGQKKYFTVPVYVHEINKKKLPTRVLPVAKRDGASEIDESFKFHFSLFPNDLVKIIDQDKKETFGYYVKYGVSNGAYSLIGHAGVSKKDTDLIRKNIGRAETVEKYQVDMLGNYYKVGSESRIGRVFKKS